MLEVGRTVDVGGGCAHLRDDLGEDGAAETVLTAAQIDQQQDGRAVDFVPAGQAES
jgi:hypothetical protein